MWETAMDSQVSIGFPGFYIIVMGLTFVYLPILIGLIKINYS